MRTLRTIDPRFGGTLLPVFALAVLAGACGDAPRDLLTGPPASAGVTGPSQGELIENTRFEHVVQQDVTRETVVVVTGADPGFTPTVTYPATLAEIEAQVASQLPPGSGFTVDLSVESTLLDTSFEVVTTVEVTTSEDAVWIGDLSDPDTLLVLQGTVTFTTTETTIETRHILEVTTVTIRVLWLTPETEDDCKKGGWERLADHNGRPFKNQGDCVSYVATGGSNLADG